MDSFLCGKKFRYHVVIPTLLEQMNLLIHFSVRDDPERLLDSGE